MLDLVAVYLDLRDLQSARIWRWLTALGRTRDVEVRPFCLDVADPWECDAPTFGLELLMLLEQARDHGPDTMAAVVDAAFARMLPDTESASAELATWLAIGASAGLPLEAYDAEMERLKAEVGYWMAEAREEHGVVRTPTLLFDDGTTVYVQLDRESGTEDDPACFLDVIARSLRSVGSRTGGR